jgi:hypothetical protein
MGKSASRRDQGGRVRKAGARPSGTATVFDGRGWEDEIDAWGGRMKLGKSASTGTEVVSAAQGRAGEINAQGGRVK